MRKRSAGQKPACQKPVRMPAAAVARQVASLLLTYPDQALIDRLDLLRAAVDGLPGGLRASFSEPVEYVAATALAEQQRQYVATFDLRKKCCPYLTWWVHGDTRNRGFALVTFNTAYRAAGMPPPGDELPDHLAVVLEFAATVDPEAGEKLLVEHLPALELLRQALHKAPSPLAGTLDAVCATLPKLSGDVVAAARRIARQGTPQELVGLEPYHSSWSAQPPSPAPPRSPDHPMTPGQPPRSEQPPSFEQPDRPSTPLPGLCAYRAVNR